MERYKYSVKYNSKLYTCFLPIDFRNANDYKINNAFALVRLVPSDASNKLYEFAPLYQVNIICQI